MNFDVSPKRSSILLFCRVNMIEYMKDSINKSSEIKIVSTLLFVMQNIFFEYICHIGMTI